MRKLLLLGTTILLTAATYAPTLFTVTSMTKSAKYSVKGKHGITYRMSAAGTAYLNGTGSGWPVDQNTPVDFYPFKNISTLTFTCTSTAAGSPNKLYVQEF